MKKKSFVTGLVVLAMTAMLSGCGGKKIVRVETNSGGVQHQYDAVSEDSVRVIYSDGSAKNLNELEDYMFNRSDYSEGLTVYVKGQGTFNVELTNYVKADTVTWKYNGTEGLLPSNISMGSVDPSAFSYEFVYSDGFNTSGVPQSVELSADGGNVMSEIVLKNGVTQKVLWGYNQYAVADVQPIGEGNVGTVDVPKDNPEVSNADVEEGGAVPQQVVQSGHSQRYEQIMNNYERVVDGEPDGEFKDLAKVSAELDILLRDDTTVEERLPLYAKYWNYQYYVSSDSDVLSAVEGTGTAYKVVQNTKGNYGFIAVDTLSGTEIANELSYFVQKWAIVNGDAELVEQTYGLRTRDGLDTSSYEQDDSSNGSYET